MEYRRDPDISAFYKAERKQHAQSNYCQKSKAFEVDHEHAAAYPYREVYRKEHKGIDTHRNIFLCIGIGVFHGSIQIQAPEYYLLGKAH